MTKTNTIEPRGKIKFRVIDFELEGSTAALEESIKHLSSAITRPSATPVKLISGKSPEPAASNETHIEPAADAGEIEGPAHEEAQQDQVREAENGVKKYRKFPQPQTIDLPLTSGEVTWKDFVQQKNPKNVRQQYLVTAFYLKKFHDIKHIGINHIGTCFRTVGWSIPKDAGAPFRALKGKGAFYSTDDPGTFELNHVGENQVIEMDNNQ